MHFLWGAADGNGSDEVGCEVSSQEEDPEDNSEVDSEQEEDGGGALVFPASYSTALAQLLQVNYFFMHQKELPGTF